MSETARPLCQGCKARPVQVTTTTSHPLTGATIQLSLCWDCNLHLMQYLAMLHAAARLVGPSRAKSLLQQVALFHKPEGGRDDIGLD
jgi:Tfp pilus assembly protein PilN